MPVYKLVSRSSGALPTEGGLPREFRIFAPGRTTTTSGVDLFDAEAARSVMSAYRAYGNRLMLDLEHQSLSGSASRNATDALGWFDLELRADGSLWAVNVNYTPEGERRLRDRSQVYLSPAFKRDSDTGRVLELVNCALCAMPATHGATQLVAASRFGARTSSVIATRVTNGFRDQVTEIADSLGLEPGVFARLALLAATADKGRAVAALAALAKLADGSTPADPTAAGGADPAPVDAHSRTHTSATGGRIVKTSRGEISLSAREIKNCEELGAKVEAYAENKSIRDAARRGGK